MIDPKELRIGNYVQFYRKIEDQDPSQASICSIFETDGDYYVKFEDGFCVNTERGIKAIFLSKELISKLGFRQESNTYFYGDIELSIGCNDDSLYLTFNWNEYQISSTPILYLHQLQNIYFGLTGKELMVNL